MVGLILVFAFSAFIFIATFACRHQQPSASRTPMQRNLGMKKQGPKPWRGNLIGAVPLKSDSTTSQTTSITSHTFRELFPRARPFYLAEGGANIVYKFTIQNEHAPSITTNGGGQQRDNRKLLRLRKQIKSATPYADTVNNFDSYIKPMFDNHELVDQELVRLPKGFIAYCNEQLRVDEARNSRPKERYGVYLSTKEPFGLMITDMTPVTGSGECLWEFKPKWLLQSPSAPPDAKRCRTCALREMKNFNARNAGNSEKQSFCPLDLVSDNFEEVLRATRFICGGHGRKRVAAFLHRNSTLLRLQECQRQMNAVGLPGLQANFRERAISMTLRDCTMFVKVPLDELQPLEARLGDLDFKSGIGGKLQYWRETESRLIEDGWYSGTHPDQKSSECSLQGPRDDFPTFEERET
ncbi:inositol-pentakisphosphate 2-kinase [Histoplasma ohiense]|nr:inositol-pentakisphosphate 2-kinase [Histoplasma ohiense (nom. inval.)]